MASIKGIAVGATRFSGASSIAELSGFGVFQPSRQPKKTDVKNLSHNQRKSAALREQVQRGMTAERVRNAEDFARYIRGVETGSIIGGTPSITLFIDSPCIVKDGGLQIPYGAGVIAIDGETQLEARFILAEDQCEGAADWMFPVSVFHSCDHNVAKQYLVDVNMFGLRMNTKVAASLDQTGRLTLVVRDALKSLGLLPNVLNFNATRPTKRQLIARTQLWAGIVGFLTGKPSTTRNLSNLAEEFNNPLPKSKEFEFSHEAAVFAAIKMLELAQSNPETRDLLADSWSGIGASFAGAGLVLQAS